MSRAGLIRWWLRAVPEKGRNGEQAAGYCISAQPGEWGCALPESRRVIAPEALLRGAVMHYLQHSNVDMEALAAELSISRATLYRAVGSRDALLGEVLWALARLLLDEARAEARGAGADRVIQVSRVFEELMSTAQQLRQFVAAEPQTAARVLVTPATDLQQRGVEAQLKIFREAGLTGDEEDLRRRAYLYVRLLGSVMYSDLLGVSGVEFELAEPALRALLPE
ncbi:QsdR family transcriptional regulator [Actinoplanes sp. NPDC024001]|uniref:QsdR family transcriptional regulator n=1 Tax=Actinoplanes sp. NPDC024001 TaxID=3154598 RepID=UPI00341078B7